MQALDARVLLTIKYSDQFEYPLTAGEVWKRLIFGLPRENGAREIEARGSKVRASGARGGEPREVVSESLLRLKELGYICDSDKHWTLANRSATQLVRERVRRARLSKSKLKAAESLFRFLKLLPWVRGVAVTGSVAMNNAKEDDDLDFMIVTSVNRLWLVRPLVVFYAWIKGRRRSWHQEESNSWCFNLWLDANHLSLPLKNRNYYTAYEVYQAKWIITKEGLKNEFLSKNSWASIFYPNLANTEERENSLEDKTLRTPRAKTHHKWAIFDFLNHLAYKAQLRYMESHRTTEKVGEGYAFFHPRDTYSQIERNLNNESD